MTLVLYLLFVLGGRILLINIFPRIFCFNF